MTETAIKGSQIAQVAISFANVYTGIYMYIHDPWFVWDLGSCVAQW